mgnify:CR=1 FL=1|tara:strand:- start:23127 stop:23609 length:483 start_codon:yes stop_codon:yes gene_type:complete
MNNTLEILKEAINLEDISSEGAKVAIIPMGGEHPEGYQVLEVRGGNINLDQFSESECTEILAPELMDYFSFEDLNPMLVSLVKKIRIGGTIVIGGVDARMMARGVVGGSIQIYDLNKALFSRRSITDINLTKEVLISLGLKIVSARLIGLKYEIEATRAQ